MYIYLSILKFTHREFEGLGGSLRPGARKHPLRLEKYALSAPPEPLGLTSDPLGLEKGPKTPTRGPLGLGKGSLGLTGARK